MIPSAARIGGPIHPCSTDHLRKKTTPRTAATAPIQEKSLTPMSDSQSKGTCGGGGVAAASVAGLGGGGGAPPTAAPALSGAEVAAGGLGRGGGGESPVSNELMAAALADGGAAAAEPVLSGVEVA